jgi:CHASE2 domain-containing sensor protein
LRVICVAAVIGAALCGSLLARDGWAHALGLVGFVLCLTVACATSSRLASKRRRQQDTAT